MLVRSAQTDWKGGQAAHSWLSVPKRHSSAPPAAQSCLPHGAHALPQQGHACRDQEALEGEIRKNPQFKSATNFQYAFKLRDKNKPNAWYTVDNLTVLPKKEDIEATIGDKIGAYFQSLRGTVQR